MAGLSKSKIIAHRQCPKRLWLQINQPDLAETSSGTEMLFQTGNRVGEIARNLHENGVLVETWRTEQALIETNELLKGEPRPVFEGAFLADDVLIRADLLLPVTKGFDLVEVKSSSQVKGYHLEDATIQSWVLQQSGVDLASTRLAHIDTSFVYPGGGDYRGLLNYADISAEVGDLIDDVPGWIKAAKNTLTGTEPNIEPGEQCTHPFECPFMNYCSPCEAEDPSIYSPMILPYKDGKQLGADLIEEGYVNLCDVPESRFTNPKHQRIHRVSKTGVAELDAEAGRLLRGFPYPRYYIDFESINPAVPIWAISRPYQQITFQWSCHVEHVDGLIEHYDYLSEGNGDPRRGFAESLINVLKSEGPIYVYFAGFEKTRIQELADLYDDLKPALEAINERVVDLLPIARDYYYHPDMKGSWSIKVILPTIAAELSYDNLEVGDGAMAMDAFAEMIDESTTQERMEQLREGLLRYCERDTLAMLRLANYFQGN